MRTSDPATAKIRHSSLEGGFTLMELLVSMTIISLLSTTILFGWRIAAGAWGRANELVEEQRRVSAIHQVLEMQIAEMLPVSPWLGQGNLSVFFQGEPQTARFLSRYSLLTRSRSGLYRIEYQIADAGDGSHQLLVNEIPVGNVVDSGSLLSGREQDTDGMKLQFVPFERTPQTRVLLDNLEEAHFEYYRPASPSGGGGWVPEWAGGGIELPRAMAIRLTAQRDANDLQPVSIVAGIENFTKTRR